MTRCIVAHHVSLSWDFSGKNTGVGCHDLSDPEIEYTTGKDVVKFVEMTAKVLEKTLESPLDSMEIKPVSCKEN